MPKYAFMRVTPIRVEDLAHVESHNRRATTVPFCDPQKRALVKQIRLDGPNLEEAIRSRTKQLGAKPAGKNRAVAAEAVLALTDDSGDFPPDEEISQKACMCADELFGSQTIVGVWFHADEKSPHVHVVFLPVAEAVPPGCPGGVESPRPVKRVAWHQFSGGAERVYRKPRKERQTRSKRKHIRQSLPKAAPKPECRRNHKMAEWQTAWSALWQEQGYRRGIPSSRKHMPIAWVRGELEKVVCMQITAEEEFDDVFRRGLFSEAEWKELRSAATPDAVIQLLRARIEQAHKAIMAPLAELARRGISGAQDRIARAEIADAMEAQTIELSAAKEQIAALQAKVDLAETALRLPQADFCDQLMALDDSELAELLTARRRARQMRTGLPPLPTPTATPAPKQQFNAP